MATQISGVQYSGMWTLKQAHDAIAASTWPIALNDSPLFTWGANNFSASGSLGLGNRTTYSTPQQVGSSNWLAVTAGQYHTMAIARTGALYTWGGNSYGQLGLGNRTYYSSPMQVGSLTTWSSLNYQSGDNTLAIKTDGTLWGWGRNIEGSLGLGNVTAYSSPKQVGALTNWLQVTGSRYVTAAIKTNGTLWTWGYNIYGQLGDGTTVSKSSPIQIGALTNWSKVRVGGFISGFCIALKTDGTLWSWGRNNEQQLGLSAGTGPFTTDYSSPKQIGALTSWSDLGVGAAHGVALTTSGAIYTWGRDDEAQLGDRTSNGNTKGSPNQMGALTSWTKVFAGNNMSGAISNTKSLWVWGQGGSPRGDGTPGNSLYPVQIGSPSTFTTASWNTFIGSALAG